MNPIIIPKLIALDTSVLGRAAKDYFDINQDRRRKALKFLSIINERGLIPLFCFHHFQEIFQHDDDSS